VLVERLERMQFLLELIQGGLKFLELLGHGETFVSSPSRNGPARRSRSQMGGQ
jgi:hypothetical protein